MKHRIWITLWFILTLIACRQSDTQLATVTQQTVQAPVARMSTDMITTSPTIPSTGVAPTPQNSQVTPLKATPQSQGITYQGRSLPSPLPTGLDISPPPAWLIIGDQAIPASWGTFCYSRIPDSMKTCADVFGIPPDVITATLPLTIRPIIVIDGAESVLQSQQSDGTNIYAPIALEAWLQPWIPPAPPSPSATLLPTQTLQVEGSRQGNLVVFTLGPLGAVKDQLLAVKAIFPGQGDVQYFWRLNPDPPHR